jgi:hypothetical protein
VDLVVVVLDHFRLFTEDEAERTPDVTDIQGLVIRIQKEYDAVHCSLKPAGTRPVNARIVQD